MNQFEQILKLRFSFNFKNKNVGFAKDKEERKSVGKQKRWVFLLAWTIDDPTFHYVCTASLQNLFIYCNINVLVNLYVTYEKLH